MSLASDYSGKGEVPPNGAAGGGSGAAGGTRAGAEAAGGGSGMAGLVRVVKGSPDEAELAALVAGIVAARAAGPAADADRGPASAWTDRARRLGLPSSAGRDAWRWSARPY